MGEVGVVDGLRAVRAAVGDAEALVREVLREPPLSAKPPWSAPMATVARVAGRGRHGGGRAGGRAPGRVAGRRARPRASRARAPRARGPSPRPAGAGSAMGQHPLGGRVVAGEDVDGAGADGGERDRARARRRRPRRRGAACGRRSSRGRPTVRRSSLGQAIAPSRVEEPADHVADGALRAQLRLLVLVDEAGREVGAVRGRDAEPEHRGRRGPRGVDASPGSRDRQRGRRAGPRCRRSPGRPARGTSRPMVAAKRSRISPARVGTVRPARGAVELDDLGRRRPADRAGGARPRASCGPTRRRSRRTGAPWRAGRRRPRRRRRGPGRRLTSPAAAAGTSATTAPRSRKRSTRRVLEVHEPGGGMDDVDPDDRLLDRAVQQPADLEPAEAQPLADLRLGQVHAVVELRDPDHQPDVARTPAPDRQHGSSALLHI